MEQIKRRKTSDAEVEMCLVCLETPASITVSTCQHSYCKPCLTKHAESHLQTGEAFPCPTCRVQCPRRILSDDQCVLGLESTTHSAGEVAGQTDAGGEHETGIPGCSKAGTPVVPTGADTRKEPSRGNCKICHIQGKQTAAESICAECFSLLLCKDCTALHGKNKATASHVVTLIPKEDQQVDVYCKKHQALLKGYCCTCSQPVCSVCILLDHSDHQTKTLGDACLAKVYEVKTALKLEEKRLEMLKEDQVELEASKGIALEMEATLLKSIEDHAEACIQNITKKKDQLKQKLKEDFQVIGLLTKHAGAMPELVRKSEQVVSEAKKLLREAELFPIYLEKLSEVKMKEQLEELSVEQPKYEQEREEYRRRFADLRNKAPTFYPETTAFDIGSFDKPLSCDKLKEQCRETGYCKVACTICHSKPRRGRTEECEERGYCRCDQCATHWPKSSDHEYMAVPKHKRGSGSCIPVKCEYVCRNCGRPSPTSTSGDYVISNSKWL